MTALTWLLGSFAAISIAAFAVEWLCEWVTVRTFWADNQRARPCCRIDQVSPTTTLPDMLRADLIARSNAQIEAADERAAAVREHTRQAVLGFLRRPPGRRP